MLFRETREQFNQSYCYVIRLPELKKGIGSRQAFLVSFLCIRRHVDVRQRYRWRVCLYTFDRLIYVIGFNFSSLPINYTDCLKNGDPFFWYTAHALWCPCLQYGTSLHVAHTVSWIIVDPPPATNCPSINFSGASRSTSKQANTTPPRHRQLWGTPWHTRAPMGVQKRMVSHGCARDVQLLGIAVQVTEDTSLPCWDAWMGVIV